jgi:hypothetical protein
MVSITNKKLVQFLFVQGSNTFLFAICSAQISGCIVVKPKLFTIACYKLYYINLVKILLAAGKGLPAQKLKR